MKRKPDLEIGGSERPYMRRWWIIPRNRWFNIYLHQIIRDDDDRALHDHPWWNISIPLKVGYYEVQFVDQPVAGCALPETKTIWRAPWRPIFRRAKTAHRLQIPPTDDERNGRGIVWSLFITGANLRGWGFWCPAGRWIPWREFTAGDHGEIIGRGCE